jgi:hypothetical protein
MVKRLRFISGFLVLSSAVDRLADPGVSDVLALVEGSVVVRVVAVVGEAAVLVAEEELGVLGMVTLVPTTVFSLTIPGVRPGK